MKNRRVLLYLALVAMLALMPVGTMRILWPHFLWQNESLHCTIETVGALAAILMAIVLLQKQPDEGGKRLFWVAMGLLGAGILDGFHAACRPGQGFVLLHSTAVLVGGFGFALVWLPESDRYTSMRKWILWAVITGSTLFGIWALLFHETLPVMVQDGEFTTTAKVLNLLSGVFFIAAAGRFLLDFHRSVKLESYLFSCMALLFGLASLLFTYSALWDDAWWFWHAVRLSAYLLVMGFVVHGYLRTALSLRAEIAERQQAEEALRESEERLKEAQALGRIGNWGFDLDTQKIEWSDEVYALYERDKALGPPSVEEEALYYPPEQAEELRKFARIVVETRKGLEYDVTAKLPSGKTAFFSATMHPIKDDKGRVIKLFGTVQDITERKRAEELFQTLATSSPSCVYIAQDGKFQFVNPQLEKVTGFSRDELLGTDASRLVVPVDREMVRETAVQMLRGKRSAPYEYRGFNKAGEVRWILETVTAITYRGKRAALGNHMDITERRQAEEQVRHLNATLRAVRSVNQLITRERDKERLIQSSCDLLVATRGYEKAWILLVNENRSLASFASAGLGEQSQPFLECLKAQHHPECLRELWAQESPLVVYNRPGMRHKGCILAEAHSSLGVFRCKLEYEGKEYGVVGVSIPPYLSSAKEEQELFLELCRDISYALASIERDEKRQEADKRAKQLQEHLELQIRRMPLALILWDKEFRIRSWNPAAERIFGFRAEEAIGKHPYDIIVPKEGQSQVDDVWRRLLEGDMTAHSTNDNITKDGRTIICDWLNTPLRQADGTVTGVLSMVQDITERQHAEEQLRESEEFSSSLLDNAPSPIIVFNPDTSIRYVNPELEKLTGYTAQELIGRKAPYPWWGPEVITELSRTFTAVVSDRLEARERLFRKKNGEQFWVEITRTPIKDNSGQLKYSVSVWVDITQRKQMEQQLLVTDRLASIGELASGIAHELNNPLTSVIGFSELLLEKNIPEDVREDLTIINREAQRTAVVVRNLLTFARKHEPVRQAMDINEAIEAVLALRAYEQKIHNIQVNSQLAPDLPQVVADRFQLQQVFLNIIINAEYFMNEAHEKGTLTITTERVGDMVRAAFSDDGPGIAPDALGHVFDPFFTTKEVGKGTGLGLSIAYGIVTAHGGRIYAQNELGQGATFIVELPIAK